MSELKPCPAGHPAEYDSQFFDGVNTGHAVCCSICGWCNSLWESKEEAYEAWDTRHEADRESMPTVADYEATLADHRRLVRELDVALNGEKGAAEQASLCDIVS